MGRQDEPLIAIRLETGRHLWCYKYVTARTYDGFDIRTPSEMCNEIMLKVASQAVERYFGKWPLYIVQPVRQVGQVDYPSVRVTAMFTSSPLRKNMDLSSAVTIWFQEEQTPVPDETAQRALQAIDWESLATDYEW